MKSKRKPKRNPGKKIIKKYKKTKSDKKTKKIVIPVSPIGILEKYHYYFLDTRIKRRKSLDRMIKFNKYKDIISRLNAVAIRFKNKKPKISKNIRSDMKYLKIKYRPDLL